MDINTTYCMDCREGLKQLSDNSVDLVVTSPPYDNLRTYQDTCEWNFQVFEEVAKELYRVVKEGRAVVWVVGDATLDGSETGSSFRQALKFMEVGFKLHDTMIYEKNSSSFPARKSNKRYTQIFEYMFVFCKGKVRDDIQLLCDKKNKYAGHTSWGSQVVYDKFGNKVDKGKTKEVPEFSIRNNIWKYNTNNENTGHPAVFPLQLAKDHILSWSLPNELVLDPFMGSGTVAKACLELGRNYIGFEQNPNYIEIIEKRLGPLEERVRSWKKFMEA